MKPKELSKFLKDVSTRPAYGLSEHKHVDLDYSGDVRIFDEDSRALYLTVAEMDALVVWWTGKAEDEA